MIKSTFADQFKACTTALVSGRLEEARILLMSMDVGAFSPASAALHQELSYRVSQAIGSTNHAWGTAAPSLVPQGKTTSLSLCDKDKPLPGVSLVSVCMNRQDNLLKALPSWLASDANEIIVVDWSSATEVAPLLAHIDDPRLRVVRIDGEKSWILTHAFNVGLRLARHQVVFKLDADIQISTNFLVKNRFRSGEFVRGFWRSAFDHGQEDQKYLNGSFGAHKTDLRALGYYDERIRTYGWDDSDMYGRLSHAGLAGRLLAFGSLVHLHQAEASRLENQSVLQDSFLGWFGPADFENAVNKFHTSISLDWGLHNPAQDYELFAESSRLLRGRRTTTIVANESSERDLATVLGTRQLLSWYSKPLPESIAPIKSNLELARLLKQAHQVGCGQGLISALADGKGLVLLEADTETLQRLAEQSIEVICTHQASAADVIIVVTDDGYRPCAAPPACKNVLRASKSLVDTLAKALGAIERDDLHRFEAELTSQSRTGCTKWVLSIQTLARSAVDYAQSIIDNLPGRFLKAEAPTSSTNFVTSVYDEGNLIRLLEYLACVALNLQTFGHLFLMYEVRNGLFQQVIQAMCRDLDIAPSRLSLLPCGHRPTFEELFSMQALLPNGALLVVANADIAFDATLIDLAQTVQVNYIYVLSRWELTNDGKSAELIRLQSGIPNVFSADVWAVCTPFDPDFRLDYPIGSFHCDSFINNQIYRSNKFSYSNPCLDIHAFHLHDSRFNSSSEKEERDRAEIERRYDEERARNAGEDPLKGAPWSYLRQSSYVSSRNLLTKWRPKGLVLDAQANGIDLGTLLLLEVLRPLVEGDDQIALVLNMREQDGNGAAGQLIARYKQHFSLVGLLFETDNRNPEHKTLPPELVHRCYDVKQILEYLHQGSIDLFEGKLAELLACPADEADGLLLRVEFSTILSPAQTVQLLQTLRSQLPDQFERLQNFIGSLNYWKDDYTMLQPMLEFLTLPPPRNPLDEDSCETEVSNDLLSSKDTDQPYKTACTAKASIVLMVSLYEDPAETRRLEMIRCLRTNSQIFDRIIVLYEQPVGTNIKLENSIADELRRLSDISRCEAHLADFEILMIHERPAYRDFFKIGNSFPVSGQKPWIVIANSDIAFDGSLQRIHELDTRDDVLIWLSRWDKCADDSRLGHGETYLDAEGSKWVLIESTIHGSKVPNYLSADVWIYKKQPVDWDEYTYKVGTYFCDSFFANRAFRSGRPVINPCRSIRCFHHHDESINSSAQKFEDKDLINRLYAKEEGRLGGVDPVAGVQWSTLEMCMSPHLNTTPFRWNPNGGLWLKIGPVVNLASTLLIIEAALQATERSGKNVFVSMEYDESHNDFGFIAQEFCAYLCNPRLFLDLRPCVYDLSLPTLAQHLSFPDNCKIHYPSWPALAELITAHIESYPDSHHSERTHLKLLQLLAIDELYTVVFLSARYPDQLRECAQEARMVAQFSLTSQKAQSTSFEPKFSLVTSLFRAAKYLPRLLENYEAIASLGACELVIVDANTDATDRIIIENFMAVSEYTHTIQYIQLDDDPGIYGCWMKGIRMAKSPLVSNFNADDRRSAVHPHLLARYLETNMEVDVCFTALKPSKLANTSWYELAEIESWFHWYEDGHSFRLHDFLTEREGIYCSRNVAHCMPMWRKALHDELGPFREDKYGTSADWAFWLECLSKGKSLHLASSVPLGVYFINESSHNRANDILGTLENKIIYDYFGIEQASFIQQ